jgi:FkbM family methyltransferase
VKDVAGWDTVALQWKQFLFNRAGLFLPVEEYRAVTRINDKVARVFGRTNRTEPARYNSFGPETHIVVVSPVWNAEEYIASHILSVASQDYDNWKHVIVDDMSTDNTFAVAQEVIASLPPHIQGRIHLIGNSENKGAIANQLYVTNHFLDQNDDIVVLLDGDDWLVNNNTIFKYLNDIYSQGYDFTYGSMWSLADNIPLISQDYPEDVKQNRAYREYHFNWKIPYTHLRTARGLLFGNLDSNNFKDDEGRWMKSGADNPLFYALIEQVDPNRIYCNKEVIVNYNDINPLNDYKVRGEEQNKNADRSYSSTNMTTTVEIADTSEIRPEMKIYVKEPSPVTKRILLAIPTNKNIEAETYRSLWNLEVPEGYELDFQYFYGYQVDQIRNLIAEWAKGYDYLLSIDSDIVVPPFALKNMLAANKDIISGLYIQRIPNTHTLEVYMNTPGGGCDNIPYRLIKDRGIVEIAACGMGIALIKGDVFRKLDYPHFYYQSSLTMEGTVSEDVYFCQKARKAGFKIWADSSIKCRHIGQKDFIVEDEKQERYKEIGENVSLPADHIEYLHVLEQEINPKVIFDIGSSVLHWSRPAREIWPNAQFFLFEAMEDVGPYYHEHGFHDFFLGVLSDLPGKHVLFYADPMNFGGNSYYPETTGFFEGKQVQRVTNSIDNIRKLYGIPSPDLVKMDVQGAELDVLRGAVETFADTKDFILELQHVHYNEGAPLADVVIGYMDSVGYDLIANFTRTPVDGDYHFRKRGN